MGVICASMCESVSAGSGVSKVLTGAATVGVGALIGVPVPAAVLGGVATTAGAFARTPTRVAVNVNPATGQATGLNVQVEDGHGHNVVDFNTENFGRPQMPNPNPFARQAQQNADELARIQREEAARARASFSNWTQDAIFSVHLVDCLNYHVAKDRTSEFWCREGSRGWEKTNRKIINWTRFANQPANLQFEETPLQWYFDQKTIDGRSYTHAWTATCLDFLVPSTENHTICAPDWYVEKKRIEREKQARNQYVGYADFETREAVRRLAEGQIRESAWGVLDAAWAISHGKYRESYGFANDAQTYYESAKEALRSIGAFFDDVCEELVTPGGVDNLRRYNRGDLSIDAYYASINADLAEDAMGSMVGSFLGGTIGGAAGAAVSGGAAAIPAANYGAAQGAVAGYVATRATRAVARTTVSWFKGIGGIGGKQRTQATKQDNDNYINGLKDKGVLSKKNRTTDNHDYFKVEKKCEYLGIKFKKGDFLSRDTLHNEWEWFKGAKNHQGAIDPITGKLNTGKADPSRILKLK